MARTDVVVAGLGVVGAATALALAEAGAAVTGLDAHDPPHDLGSSHGATRITRLAVGEGDAYVPLVARSHERWRELEARGSPPLLVACGLLLTGDARGGTHHGRVDFAAATRAIAVRHGIPHELLDPGEVGGRFGALVPAAGTSYFEPGAGYLRAEACVDALHGAARAAGATLRSGVELEGFAARPSGVEVATSDGTIVADRLVLCVGAWLPSLVPALAPLLRVHRQVAHWFEVQPAAAADLAALPAYLWFHGAGPDDWFYGFPLVDGPAAGLKVATETFAATTDPERVVRSVGADEAADVHRRHVAGRLRGVAASTVRSSACLYTVTDDFGFVLDALPGEPRVVVVSACSGHGFKHAPAVGECAAALALGREPPVDCSAFALARLG